MTPQYWDFGSAYRVLVVSTPSRLVVTEMTMVSPVCEYSQPPLGIASK
jgi:hypothetical protein